MRMLSVKGGGYVYYWIMMARLVSEDDNMISNLSFGETMIGRGPLLKVLVYLILTQLKVGVACLDHRQESV